MGREEGGNKGETEEGQEEEREGEGKKTDKPAAMIVKAKECSKFLFVLACRRPDGYHNRGELFVGSTWSSNS